MNGLAPHPTGGDEAQIVHRRGIFKCCMPLLRTHGYRGVSVKALAQASGLSVAGLYHYFPTKRDLALYPLTPEFCLSSAIARYPAPDAFGQLLAWIEGALDELHEIRLALDIAAGLGDEAAVPRRTFFALHTHWLAGAARSLGMSDTTAAEFAGAMTAVAAGENSTGTITSSAALRRQLQNVMRGYVVPDLIEASQFERSVVSWRALAVSASREEALPVRSSSA